MRQWRLLRESRFRDGADNMAVDGVICDAVARGDQPPTLRLYGWSPFCLSLGYGQRARDVDRERLASRGWDLVRRQTGGKAILHGDELTYSLCLPAGHQLYGADVVDSYRQISRGLLQALESLGLNVQASRQTGASASQNPVCFDAPSHYEITIAGRKLIGSAQMRRKGALLQHGTLPLRGDLARICDALAFESEDDQAAQRRQVRRRAITLSEALGREASWEETADALQVGFGNALNVSFCAAVLSMEELTLAADLRQSRFANEAYTFKR